MSLQLGAALREGWSRLVSRTGAILLAVYMAFMLAILPLSNTMIARLYERIGLTEVTDALPLVLDVGLGVAAAGYAALTVFGMYLSLVATRTFVAGASDRFPEGALTRNVPLGMANLLVGGLVYGLLVAIGTVLLVVPGIVAYIAFLFLLPYVAVEDKNFAAALRSSFRLSRGHWLMLFALLVVLIGASAVVGAFTGVLFGLFLPLELSQVANMFIQAPISLYLLAVIAAVFNQLRDDEGPDDPGSSPTTDTPSAPA